MPRAMYTITIEGERRYGKNGVSGITGIIIGVICVFVYPDNISNLTVVCSLWQSLVEISD